MTDQEQPTPDGTLKEVPLWVKVVVRLVAACIFMSIPLFWGAGTFDWPRGWLFLALFASTFLVNLALLLNKNPTLIRERWKRRKDTKRFDKIFGWAYLVAVVAFGAASVVVVLLVVRTALEDRTLRNELTGYTEYCEKTRYRLIPGVW